MEGCKHGECAKYGGRWHIQGCPHRPSAGSAGSLPLPEVAGRIIEGSIEQLEFRARFYIGKELEKLDPDNALIAVLSDTVRLGREFSDTMNGRQ